MTLPLRPLIKLSGLNLSQQRYSDRLIGIETLSDGTQFKFRVLNNSNYLVGDEVSIQGVVGLPDPSVLSIYQLEDDDTIVFGEQDPFEYPIGYLESFTIDSGSYYYIRVYIDSGTTINVGSTVTFSGLTGTFDELNAQVLTVYSANSYSLIFRTTGADPFGIDEAYFPSISSTATAPNSFQQTLALATNVAAEAKLILLNSNGELNASMLVATIALAPAGYTDEVYLTDYNRTPLQITHDDIQESTRTVDGSLRYHHNATKRKFSVSWHDLPGDQKAIETVDDGLAANEMLQVYKNNKGTFYLELYNRNSAKKDSAGPDLKVLVIFAEQGCEYQITRRGYYISSDNIYTDLWGISLNFEEV